MNRYLHFSYTYKNNQLHESGIFLKASIVHYIYWFCTLENNNVVVQWSETSQPQTATQEKGNFFSMKLSTNLNGATTTAS